MPNSEPKEEKQRKLAFKLRDFWRTYHEAEIAKHKYKIAKAEAKLKKRLGL